MEYEKCYVFQPEDEPPSKKRRLEASGLHKSWPSRHKHFKQTWHRLDEAFTEAISAVNEQNVTNLNDFLETARKQDVHNIPTGIILLEPGSSSRAHLLDNFIRRGSASTCIIALDSSAAPNLKTALKSINSAALRDADAGFDLEAIDDADEDEPVVTKAKSIRKPKGRRLLAYDLEILKEYVDQSKTTTLVIHLEDTEGFSGEVLSDLVEHLSHWNSRIPLVLLMNVSTSIDMLERRLTRAARSKLKSKLFPAATCEEEFEALIRVLMKDDSTLVLGPSIIRLAAQRQSDYLQDISSIKIGLKYASMCAFFANPLTVFFDQGSKQSITQDTAEALRIVPSFRTAVRTLLDQNDTQQARKLLGKDDALTTYARQQLKQGRAAIHNLFTVLDVIWQLQRHITSTKASSLATLYIQGLSGTLRGSAGLRGLFLAMRKAPLPSLEKVLGTLDGLPDNAWQADCEAELDKLREMIASSSTDDLANGQALGSQKKIAQEKAIAELIGKICKALEAEINEALIDPKTLTFHEVFLWDTTTPYREVFAPRPRQAIERALSSPHDYLDCDCCGVEEEGDVSASQPATGVLYSLYKESGSLINAHDAWQAFQAVLGDEKDEEQTMALFQRSLAELKHLGMVKSTRKRIDHIAKVAWPGL